MQHHELLRAGELCRRLDVPYRHVRYVMERGHLPRGVARDPGHGNHRLLTPAQAYWLGIALKLKDTGIRVPLAAQVADFAREVVQGAGRQLGWDPGFRPFDGHLTTDRRWLIDVGDLTYVRLVTDADPSRDGPHELPWLRLRGRVPSPGALPAVVLRIDLARIARLVAG